MGFLLLLFCCFCFVLLQHSCWRKFWWGVEGRFLSGKDRDGEEKNTNHGWKGELEPWKNFWELQTFSSSLCPWVIDHMVAYQYYVSRSTHWQYCLRGTEGTTFPSWCSVWIDLEGRKQTACCSLLDITTFPKGWASLSEGRWGGQVQSVTGLVE